MLLRFTFLSLFLAALINEGRGASGADEEKRKAQLKCSVACSKGPDMEDYKRGKAICNPGNDWPLAPCNHKCYELPIPDRATQQKCFCDDCKKWNGKGHCRKRPDGWGNDAPIKPEECEETVCKGDRTVRYRGDFCAAPGTENIDYGPAPPNYDDEYKDAED